MKNLLDRKREYFDAIAEKWDSIHEHRSVRERLRLFLDSIDIAPDERILDLGCGTGTLAMTLLEYLSEGGSVLAVDFSQRMIRIAQAKIPDKRVLWLNAEASRLPVASATIDRAVCYSAWPHFVNSAAAAEEISRVLRRNAPLHILHLLQREEVNGIHARAGGPIGNDQLPPASELGSFLEKNGFSVSASVDDHRQYIVSGVKSQETTG